MMESSELGVSSFFLLVILLLDFANSISDCPDPLADCFIKPLKKLISADGSEAHPTSPFADERGKDSSYQPTATTCAPNIALNLHGVSTLRDLLLVTVIGIAMQFGILAYAGLTVYHPSLQQRFSKDGEPALGYPFPLMASGTVLLLLGIFICAAIVDRSTCEIEIKRRGKEKLNARILWIQQCHDVSDQAFDAYVIYGRNKGKDQTLQSILTSRRNTKPSTFTEFLPKRFANLGFAEHGSLFTSQVLTVFGSVVSLVGFICQFQGFRGLNWTVSILQLVGVAVMTILRAWLRRGLIARPIAQQVPEGHELDSLALQVTGKDGKSPGGTNPNGSNGPVDTGCDFWPSTDSKISPTTSGQCDDSTIRRLWWITDGLHQTPRVRDSPSNGAAVLKENRAMDALRVRRRLGQLTAWEAKTTKLAQGVSEAIEAVMNGLCGPEISETFVWSLLIGSKNESGALIQEAVEFEVTKEKGGIWKSDPTFIDAALSLWLYQIRHSRSLKISNHPVDISPRQEILRTVGVIHKSKGLMDTPLGRDLLWWIGERMLTIKAEADLYEPNGRESKSQEPSGIKSIGFVPDNIKGFEGKSIMIWRGFSHTVSNGIANNSSDNSDGRIWSLPTDSTLESLLAQHVFMAFMWQFAGTFDHLAWSQSQTRVIRVAKFHVEDPYSLFPLRMENDVLQKIANTLQQFGIATDSDDAYGCIIPPLSFFDHLPIDFIDRVREAGEVFEKKGRWEVVIPTYIRLFNECFSSASQESLLLAAAAVYVDVHCSLGSAIRRRERQSRDEDLTDLRRLMRDLEAVYRALKDGNRDNVPKTLLKIFHQVASSYKNQKRYDGIAWELYDLETNSQPLQSDAKFSNLRWTPLHAAAATGDPSKVRGQLDNNANPNKTDLAGYTALHYAVTILEDDDEKAIEIVALLAPADDDKRSFVSQNIAGRDGKLPIHIAAMKGKSMFLKLLLKAGSRVEEMDDMGQTALHLAAMSGHRQCVSILISHGARMDALDHFSRTPFHLAAVSQGPVVEEFFAAGGQDRHLDWKTVDRDKRTALHLAAISGNAETIAVLCAHPQTKDSFHLRDRLNKTALYYAIEKNKKDAVTVLVKNGVSDVNMGVAERRAPIHLAVKLGKVDIIQSLLSDRLTEVDARCENEQTALHLAAIWNRRDVAEVLIKEQADINALDIQNLTPLHKAVSKGHEQFVSLLLRHRANVEAKCDSGHTVFQFALLNTGTSSGVVRKSMLRILRTMGEANADALNKDGKTALHEAASICDVEIADFLLSECGAGIDVTSSTGMSALHIAVNSSKSAQQKDAFIDLLRRHKCNMKATDTHKRTAMHIAAHEGHELVMKSLLLTDPGLSELADGDGCLPLHLAAAKGHHTLVDLLLKDRMSETSARMSKGTKSFNINDRCSNGMTALHHAIKNAPSRLAQISVAQTLIDHGMDLNTRDDLGQTALHLLAKTGTEGLADLLLANGAEPNMKDATGKTPLHVSVDSGQFPFAYWIIKHERGADIKETCTEDGSNVLHLVIRNMKLSIEDTESVISSLLNCGCTAIIEMPDEQGTRPLHDAVRFNCLSTVKLLIENGADVNIRDNEHITPIHLALDRQKPDILEFLLKAQRLDLSRCCRGGMTVFHRAVNKAIEARKSGDEDEMKKMLGFVRALGEHADAKHSIDITNKLGSTPLHTAVTHDYDELVRILLKAGALPDFQNTNGYASLHLAVICGHWSVVQSLLEIGHANVEAQTRSEWTALHLALHSDFKGSSEMRQNIVQLLLEYGKASVSTFEPELRDSALHVAVRREFDDILSLLAQYAEFDALSSVNNDIETPLHLAVRLRNKEAVEILLTALDRFGKSVAYPRDGEQHTPLHLATELHELEIAKLLIDGGADVNAVCSCTTTGKVSGTPFHHIFNGDASDDPEEKNVKELCLSLIASEEFDFSISDSRGNTAIHNAAELGFSDTIAEMIWQIENRAIVISTIIDRQNNEGMTPLHIAAKEGHYDAFVTLLKNGADPMIKCHEDRDLMYYAAQSPNDINARRIKDKLITLGHYSYIRPVESRPGLEHTNSELSTASSSSSITKFAVGNQHILEMPERIQGTEIAQKIVDVGNKLAPEVIRAVHKGKKLKSKWKQRFRDFAE